MKIIAKDVTEVIKNNYCVGCGVCEFSNENSISVSRNEFGAMKAKIIDEKKINNDPDLVCPFSSKAPNENYYSKKYFSHANNSNEHLGRFIATYAGHVSESDFRKNGSSGGVSSWLAIELFKKRLIDGVIHVHGSEENDLFKFSISLTENEIKEGSKTRYYSVSMNDVLNEITKLDIRVLLIGVPCFVKAINNLREIHQEINNKIAYTMSIVCGHMKTAGFAESLAWQIGVRPQSVHSVDFRVKNPGLAAQNYSFSVTNKEEPKIIKKEMMANLIGKRWDGGYFKLKACEFCDDVVGETADISIGDAWIPGYSEDGLGSNIIVVRNLDIQSLISDGISTNKLCLDNIKPEKLIKSQAAGFRDRREGMMYRLWIEKNKRKWVPQKRYKPTSKHISFVRKIIYRYRTFIRIRSINSFKFSKTIKTILFYKIEMFFYHIGLRLIYKCEKKNEQ